QREIAERIKSRGIFSNLPDKLREMLELRLNYPEETLEGLGQKANPPVSKSTVKYRWKKLESLIDTEIRK
ncbi:MAG: DNA-binding protein WhiA, partial [Synergistaceae bacterium]|nr:DNA-binding protein WhiA [Synergistaceae bacterium]